MYYSLWKEGEFVSNAAEHSSDGCINDILLVLLFIISPSGRMGSSWARKGRHLSMLMHKEVVFSMAKLNVSLKKLEV